MACVACAAAFHLAVFCLVVAGFTLQRSPTSAQVLELRGGDVSTTSKDSNLEEKQRRHVETRLDSIYTILHHDLCVETNPAGGNSSTKVAQR